MPNIGDLPPDETNYAIQCEDHASEKIGDFTFDADAADRDGYFTATSPIFDNLEQLFRYARENKITLTARIYNFPATLKAHHERQR